MTPQNISSRQLCPTPHRPCNSLCLIFRSTTIGLLLNWRTRHRAVWTEYATIPQLGFQYLVARFTLVEPQTRISRHFLFCLMIAFRTSNYRLQCYFWIHVCSPVSTSPRSVKDGLSIPSRHFSGEIRRDTGDIDRKWRCWVVNIIEFRYWR